MSFNNVTKNLFFSTLFLFQLSTAQANEVFSNKNVDVFGGGDGEETLASTISLTMPVMATYSMLDVCNGQIQMDSPAGRQCDAVLTTAGALQVSSYAALLLIILAKSENTQLLIEKSELETSISPELKSIILDAQKLLKGNGKDFSDVEVLTILEDLN